MDSYKYIRNNLILTEHSKENYHGERHDGSDRSDISIHQIVMAIKNGTFKFCGHKRFGKTYRGIRVIYKIDDSDPKNKKYVVITYYRLPKRKGKKCLVSS